MNGENATRLLLVNIGNTRFKVMTVVNGRFHRVAEGPIGAMRPEREFPVLGPGAVFTGAVLCSVRPSDNPSWIRAIRKHLGLELLVVSWNLPLGLRLRYPKPETIGPDRLCNVCAAVARFQPPVAVFDFGTAVTCDVVDASGAFIGGVIAPGLRMMSDYLHERTALLPAVAYRLNRQLIGRSTIEAIQIGMHQMMAGLVREIVEGLQNRFGSALTICATGGDARRLRPILRPRRVVLVPDLTFEGMRRIYHYARARGVAQ